MFRIGDGLDDLREWVAEESRVLPVGPWGLPGVVMMAEARGEVVDLQSGVTFRVRDHWGDFVARWVVEIKRRGEVPTLERCARAIWKAQAGDWSMVFCREVAEKLLAGAPAVVNGSLAGASGVTDQPLA